MHTNGGWIHITSKRGTVIWYIGVIVHRRVEAVTVVATLHMFRESDTWDAYVGAAQYVYDVQAVNTLFRSNYILDAFVYAYVFVDQRLTSHYSIAASEMWSPVDEMEGQVAGFRTSYLQ